MGSDPKPPLVVNRTAVLMRPNSKLVRCDIDRVREVLKWLTEGATEREPLLTALAMDAVHAIVTGRRAEELKELYEKVNPEAQRHCGCMEALFIAANLPFPDVNELRENLCTWDGAFSAVSDENLRWALTKLHGAENHTAAASVLAHLCVECGAFDVPQDSSETTLRRATDKFKQSRARLKLCVN